MDQTNILDFPKSYQALISKSNEIGFTMPSDAYIGTLLKTLVASKPNGVFLELGTGIGLSLSWMIDGMCSNSRLITIDNDQQLIAIAKEYFGKDERVEIVCDDASKYIQKSKGKQFDLVFADAWPGKYSDLDKTISMLATGGYYVIDDMRQQQNWPKGHEDNVADLVKRLEQNKALTLTKMDWSTGVLIAVKNSIN